MSIPHLFPNIGKYSVTSPPSISYNCIGWAAGDSQRWWEPAPDYYWPEGALREITLEAYITAFQCQGYEVCPNASLENGYEKIALYVSPEGEPKHAARQLRNGRWTSKLGRLEDIEHESLASLEDTDYGRVAVIMRRWRNAIG